MRPALHRWVGLGAKGGTVQGTGPRLRVPFVSLPGSCVGILGDSVLWPHSQAGESEQSRSNILLAPCWEGQGKALLLTFLFCVWVDPFSPSGGREGKHFWKQDLSNWEPGDPCTGWWFCCPLWCDEHSRKDVIVPRCLESLEWLVLPFSRTLESWGGQGHQRGWWALAYIPGGGTLSVFPNLPAPSQRWGLPCWILAEKRPPSWGGRMAPVTRSSDSFLAIVFPAFWKQYCAVLKSLQLCLTLCDPLDG